MPRSRFCTGGRPLPLLLIVSLLVVLRGIDALDECCDGMPCELIVAAQDEKFGPCQTNGTLQLVLARNDSVVELREVSAGGLALSAAMPVSNVTLRVMNGTIGFLALAHVTLFGCTVELHQVVLGATGASAGPSCLHLGEGAVLQDVRVAVVGCILAIANVLPEQRAVLVLMSEKCRMGHTRFSIEDSRLNATAVDADAILFSFPQASSVINSVELNIASSTVELRSERGSAWFMWLQADHQSLSLRLNSTQVHIHSFITAGFVDYGSVQSVALTVALVASVINVRAGLGIAVVLHMHATARFSGGFTVERGSVEIVSVAGAAIFVNMLPFSELAAAGNFSFFETHLTLIAHQQAYFVNGGQYHWAILCAVAVQDTRIVLISSTAVAALLHLQRGEFAGAIEVSDSRIAIHSAEYCWFLHAIDSVLSTIRISGSRVELLSMANSALLLDAGNVSAVSHPLIAFQNTEVTAETRSEGQHGHFTIALIMWRFMYNISMHFANVRFNGLSRAQPLTSRRVAAIALDGMSNSSVALNEGTSIVLTTHGAEALGVHLSGTLDEHSVVALRNAVVNASSARATAALLRTDARGAGKITLLDVTANLKGGSLSALVDVGDSDATHISVMRAQAFLRGDSLGAMIVARGEEARDAAVNMTNVVIEFAVRPVLLSLRRTVGLQLLLDRVVANTATSGGHGFLLGGNSGTGGLVRLNCSEIAGRRLRPRDFEGIDHHVVYWPLSLSVQMGSVCPEIAWVRSATPSVVEMTQTYTGTTASSSDTATLAAPQQTQTTTKSTTITTSSSQSMSSSLTTSSTIPTPSLSKSLTSSVSTTWPTKTLSPSASTTGTNTFSRTLPRATPRCEAATIVLELEVDAAVAAERETVLRDAVNSSAISLLARRRNLAQRQQQLSVDELETSGVSFFMLLVDDEDAVWQVAATDRVSLNCESSPECRQIVSAVLTDTPIVWSYVSMYILRGTLRPLGRGALRRLFVDELLALRVGEHAMQCTNFPRADRYVEIGLSVLMPATTTASTEAGNVMASLSAVGAATAPGLIADSQALATFSLISCSSRQQRFIMKRARMLLSPFAVGQEPDGFIWANLILTSMLLCISLVIIAIRFRCDPSDGIGGALEFARFPSVFLTLSIIFHQGVAALTMQQLWRNVWSAAAICGGLFTTVLPLAIHQIYRRKLHGDMTDPHALVFFRFEERLFAQWPRNAATRFVRRFMFPKGRWGPMRQRKCFGGPVSAFLPTWTLFATIPLLQAILVAIVAGVHAGTRVGCGVQYATLVLMYLTFAIGVLLLRPYRIPFLNVLQGLSYLVLAAILVTTGAIALNDDVPSLHYALTGLMMAQLLLSFIRVVHGMVIRLGEVCFWHGYATRVLWNELRDGEQTRDLFHKAFGIDAPLIDDELAELAGGGRGIKATTGGDGNQEDHGLLVAPAVSDPALGTNDARGSPCSAQTQSHHSRQDRPPQRTTAADVMAAIAESI